jgi:hypothetical protein
MRRRARKVDTNHAEFVRTLRGCGLSVADISGVGNGIPDIICGGYQSNFGGARVNLLVEIKSKGKLNRITPLEAEFEETWRGPMMRTESADDVLRWFGLIE